MVDNALRLIAWQHCAYVNKYRGIYAQGRAYCFLKKAEVAAAYIDAKAANGVRRPNLRALARQCKVSWHFVNKVVKELWRKVSAGLDFQNL